MHTAKSRLDPYHFGDTKVKVAISLEAPPPEVVEVRGTIGNSVRIQVHILDCHQYFVTVEIMGTPFTCVQKQLKGRRLPLPLRRVNCLWLKSIQKHFSNLKSMNKAIKIKLRKHNLITRPLIKTQLQGQYPG